MTKNAVRSGISLSRGLVGLPDGSGVDAGFCEGEGDLLGDVDTLVCSAFADGVGIDCDVGEGVG